MYNKVCNASYVPFWIIIYVKTLHTLHYFFFFLFNYRTYVSNKNKKTIIWNFNICWNYWQCYSPLKINFFQRGEFRNSNSPHEFGKKLNHLNSEAVKAVVLLSGRIIIIYLFLNYQTSLNIVIFLMLGNFSWKVEK